MRTLIWLLLIGVLVSVVYISCTQKQLAIGGILLVTPMNNAKVGVGMIIYGVLLGILLLVGLLVSLATDNIIARKLLLVLLIATFLAFTKIGWWIYATSVWLVLLGVLGKIALIVASLIIGIFNGAGLILICFLNAGLISRDGTIFWFVLVPGLAGLTFSIFRLVTSEQ
jgi:hypothetical protein